MTRFLILPALCLLAGTATAADCAFEAPRELTLDLAGITRVEFDLGASELVLSAAETPAFVRAKACSSHEDRLADIQLEQHRNGDTLVIRADSKARFTGIFFSSTYAHLRIDAQLPAGLAIAVEVGSGEVRIDGMQQVAVEVGSGDVQVRRAREVELDVGSGDARVEDASAGVRVEVGSGDIEIERIGGLTVSSVGSGDVIAEGIRGDVRIEDIGSGDVVLRDVEGSVTVEHVGSGELQARAVRGGLKVEHVGSGNVIHQDIRGAVELPDRDD